MKKSILYVGAIAMLALTSCGDMGTTMVKDPQLYSWHNYEDASYQYTKVKSDQNEKALITSYDNMFSKQTGARKVVPPGIYADNGYYLIKKGRKDDGIKMLQKEMELYPESKTFIERIIKSLQK